MIMSVLSPAILLWVLLATIEHASNARHGGFNETAVIVPDENSSQHTNLSNKNYDHRINLIDGKGKPALQADTSSIRKTSHNKSNKGKEEVRMTATSHKRHKRSSRKGNSHQGGGTKATYKVPHLDQEDQQQSYTLDYSSPKVHPPHHN